MKKRKSLIRKHHENEKAQTYDHYKGINNSKKNQLFVFQLIF